MCRAGPRQPIVLLLAEHPVGILPQRRSRGLIPAKPRPFLGALRRPVLCQQWASSPHNRLWIDSAGGCHGLARDALALATTATIGSGGTDCKGRACRWPSSRRAWKQHCVRWRHGFAGCNLTIPHKQRAIDGGRGPDPVAKRIGAISCVIVRPDSSLTGTNNDSYGFVHNIMHERPLWRADAGPAMCSSAPEAARVPSPIVLPIEGLPKSASSTERSSVPSAGVRIWPAAHRDSLGGPPSCAYGRDDVGQHDQPGDGR